MSGYTAVNPDDYAHHFETAGRPGAVMTNYLFSTPDGIGVLLRPHSRRGGMHRPRSPRCGLGGMQPRKTGIWGKHDHHTTQRLSSWGPVLRSRPRREGTAAFPYPHGVRCDLRGRRDDRVQGPAGTGVRPLTFVVGLATTRVIRGRLSERLGIPLHLDRHRMLVQAAKRSPR